MKEIAFVKMHGAGNDFIVLDARTSSFPIQSIKEHASLLCNRRTGIGADGILMLGHSTTHDYYMHYLNADGSEAGMCGNGARCLARFAFDLGLDAELSFEINNLSYRAQVGTEDVSVSFPVSPDPEKIQLDNREWLTLHTGTEHIVSFFDDIALLSDQWMRDTGKNYRNRLDLFPIGTNVNFASVVNEDHLKIVTYERGVEDLTLACGTGAIASAISWYHTTKCIQHPLTPVQTHPHIQVDCPGGPLFVSFDAERKDTTCVYHNICLHGPAVTVFKGMFTL
ncbi:diaminopimelate epimerase [Balneolaceae bacterium ANBcel3]|nr:diaminopimelate epimerase [Balneolaceae bacterium ANBcel3]